MKAFPTSGVHYTKNGVDMAQEGMDLRDYFAAKAMQAYLQNSSERDICLEEVGNWIGAFSYTVADAMMEARK